MKKVKQKSMKKNKFKLGQMVYVIYQEHYYTEKNIIIWNKPAKIHSIDWTVDGDIYYKSKRSDSGFNEENIFASRNELIKAISGLIK